MRVPTGSFQSLNRLRRPRIKESSRKTKEPKTKYPFQPAKPNKIKVGKEGFRSSVPYDAKAHGPWKLPSLASINSWYGLTLPKGVKVWMYKKDGTLKAQWEIEVINLDKKKGSDTPLVAQQLDDPDHDDDTWTWPTFNTLHVGDPSRLATTVRINSQHPNHADIIGDKITSSRHQYGRMSPLLTQSPRNQVPVRAMTNRKARRTTQKQH